MANNDTLPAVSTELVKFEGESEDQFFGHGLILTDWNEALQNPAGIRPADEIDAIKRHEPVTPGHPFAHQIWVHQQRLRISLRNNAGLPLMGDICKECGANREDPVLKMCLVCAEESNQLGYHGSRGSCFYMRPIWDIQNKSWGILYYWSGGDDTFMFWAATGWKSCLSASKALMPIKKYEDWLNRKYNGVGNFYPLLNTLFPIEQFMDKKKDLPWSPGQFETYFKGAIRNHMHRDHGLLSWSVERALDDYERDQR